MPEAELERVRLDDDGAAGGGRGRRRARRLQPGVVEEGPRRQVHTADTVGEQGKGGVMRHRALDVFFFLTDYFRLLSKLSLRVLKR